MSRAFTKDGAESAGLDLLPDRRVRDRRRLQAVPEGLVVQLDGAQPAVVHGIARRVPVVNEILLPHGPSRRC